MDEKEMSLVLCQAPEVTCGLVRDNPNNDFGRPLNSILWMISIILILVHIESIGLHGSIIQ